MTYIMIRVHSFECDDPDCKEEYEDADYYKRAVWTTLARMGWTRTRDGKHYCPDHKQEEVMPDEPVAASRDLGASRQPVSRARAAVPARATVSFPAEVFALAAPVKAGEKP